MSGPATQLLPIGGPSGEEDERLARRRSLAKSRQQHHRVSKKAQKAIERDNEEAQALGALSVTVPLYPRQRAEMVRKEGFSQAAVDNPVALSAIIQDILDAYLGLG